MLSFWACTPYVVHLASLLPLYVFSIVVCSSFPSYLCEWLQCGKVAFWMSWFCVRVAPPTFESVAVSSFGGKRLIKIIKNNQTIKIGKRYKADRRPKLFKVFKT